MEYQHFIGEGPEATALIKQVMAGVKAFQEAARTLEVKTGLKFWRTREGIGGPMLENGIDNAEARKRGLKFRCFVPGEKAFHCFLPHMGTKAGREMSAEIDKINRLRCDASDMIIKATGMEMTVYDGRVIAHSCAGAADGKIVVKIPIKGTDGGDDAMPTPPAWFRPAKESEALAVFGK